MGVQIESKIRILLIGPEKDLEELEKNLEMLQIRNFEIFHHLHFSYSKMRELFDTSVTRLHIIVARSVNIDTSTRFISRRKIPRRIRPLFLYSGFDKDNKYLFGTLHSKNINLNRLLVTRPKMITIHIPHEINLVSLLENDIIRLKICKSLTKS